MKAKTTLPLVTILCLFAALLASCSRSDTPDSELPTTLQVGDKTITVEFAITNAEQSKGLMFREGIKDDHGMLFIYRAPQQMSYWMKNVDFPIDIGFFTADGVLREIYPMYANDTLSRKSIRDDIQYALETRHNWYSENNIRPGAQLDVETAEKASAARGR